MSKPIIHNRDRQLTEADQVVDRLTSLAEIATDDPDWEMVYRGARTLDRALSLLEAKRDARWWWQRRRYTAHQLLYEVAAAGMFLEAQEALDYDRGLLEDL